jgi:glycosyltransferase involved in cell wall biosynthesis
VLSIEDIKICALGALYHGDSVDYLHDCLKSLRRQTLKIPIVIVIDGSISTDLEVVLASFPDLEISFIRCPINQGLAKALEAGLCSIASEYDYAIRFDADDINMDSRFEVIRDCFLRTNADLISSHMSEIDENGLAFSKRMVPIGMDEIRRTIAYRNPINHPASAFKINSVLAVGGYRDMPFFEDWYLWLRMVKAGFKLHNIDDYLVSFRATDAMVARRFGWSYVNNEAMFFIRRSEEKLISPISNWLAFSARIGAKLFGFQVYKKIFYWIRR